MIALPEDKRENNIYVLSDNLLFRQLEKTYLDTRKEEGRLYTDNILAQLPLVPKGNPLYYEWKIRAGSLKSLIKYFASNKNLEIMDLGCGNGWMANRLSEKTENFVYAVDINLPELKQGAAVFNGNERLKFIYADVFEDALPANSFDAVIISSAIQYFAKPAELIKKLLKLLKTSGEIHIIDSNFYSDQELNDAKSRTVLYYKSIGHPEMVEYYHHHNWKVLNEFNYNIINTVNFKFAGIINKAFRTSISPFPWIRIKAKDNI